MLEKVKSKYIMEKLFGNIKNKRKLNIIKYNKKILARLNINKEHFDNYIKLNEFNNKYNTNIEDINNKELNLENKRIGNEGLKSLFKIEFKELKELNLSYNEISDINILEKVKFKELNKLNLNGNSITDINILEKVNFKELQELYLGCNEISDINILEKVDFKELKELILSHNEITNINILEKVNFKELKVLDLKFNEISDIKILAKIKFKELKELDLSYNKINNDENNSIIKNLKFKLNLIV